jgi:tRNA(Ile)-lysidine synthase
MALLSVLGRLGPKLGLHVHAHGIDHGLRESAAAELDLAEQLAAALGVRFVRTRVHVAGGGNVQARARAARWTALCEHANTLGRAAIATAHHADDRAETVLLRLLRGAGATGLGVLPPRANAPVQTTHIPIAVVRPFLRASKAQILNYVKKHGISFATDPSNLDPRFGRTAVRTRLLPLMQELDPSIVTHLCALADELSAPARPPADWTSAFPRATREAIAQLSATRSQTTRVWLPGGLVLSAAPGPRSPGSNA